MMLSRHRRGQLIALVLVIALTLPAGLAAATSPTDIVQYNIVVTLNDDSSRLAGVQQVTWTNAGSSPVAELYLHLYPNAFRLGSTFLAESGGVRQTERMSKDGYGQMELNQVHAAGRSLHYTFVQPDDGNEQDRTLVRVALPQAVRPGESVRLDIEFTVQLPRIFARMGKHDGFVMAGQWFPKIAAYEPAGTRGRETDGWNAHQYHANTEFYANFGSYRVTINVPSDYKVAATGALVESPRNRGGQLQYVFAADNVHDFAWAADRNFCEYQALFSSDRQPQITLRLFLQPEHSYLVSDYFAAAKATLDRLSNWIGPYPYPNLTIVCPAAGASGAGGMEYPTLITGWDASLHDLELIRKVIVHEIIHQYFYGLVANNEFEEAWLDEGFTSYLEDKIMSDAFGSQIDAAAEAVTVFTPEPLVLPGWKYSSAYAYQANVYLRGKLVMYEIERIIGWTQMQSALAQYFKQFSYRHPTTADWQAILEGVTGQSWAAFFAAHVYGDSMQDYAIAAVTTQVVGPTKAISKVELAGPVEDRELRLQVTFADGHVSQLTWNPVESNYLEFEHESAIHSLQLDPAPYRVLMDHVRSNNRYQAGSGKWLALWVSHFLQLLTRLVGW